MNTEKLNNLVDSLKENTNLIDNMVNKVVSEYSEDLDELMAYLKESLTQEDAISTDAIERYYAELSNMVYFYADKVEKLNIYSDLSKAKFKEAYNKAYLQFSTEKDEKGKSLRTINENTSLSENETEYESLLNTVYEHAYKTLKLKVDMAMEMISTLKHILKRRAQEEYMSFSMNNLRMNQDGDEN